MNVLEFVIFN